MIFQILRKIINYIQLNLEFFYYRLLKGKFSFRNDSYEYFIHWYNHTWKNERAVEIPIIWREVKKEKGKVLEIGNVLSHYFLVTHDVLDKYEKSEKIKVINEDVVSFSTQKKYDLIVSISTLEHVGWDEYPRKPEKILHALENLKSLLTKGGKLIVTLPLGYNSELDKMLKSGKIKFSEMYAMKRISKYNRWIEIPVKDLLKKNIPYTYSRFPHANGIIIGYFKK